MDLKKRARQLKTDLPAIFLALSKPETPLSAKFLAAVTIVYALSPVDLIPDFIPVLGLLDDLILLPALIALTIRWIPEEVFTVCREEAVGLWEGGTPGKWVYAIPFILIWILVLGLVLRAVI